MLSILYLIVTSLVIVLFFSAFVGAIQFFIDLHKTKSELQFSGSRQKLIERLIEHEELKKEKSEEGGKNVGRPE